MPDFIDHASAQEAKFNEVAIAHQLARGKSQDQRESAKYCIECGDKIPEARRRAISGCQYCTSCQEMLEKHK